MSRKATEAAEPGELKYAYWALRQGDVIKTMALALGPVARRWYHYSSGALARSILRSVESRKGRLRKQVVKQCDGYALEVLGHLRYSPWLYVYSAVAGGFKEGWIPDNYYGSVIVPRLKGSYAVVSTLKPLNSAILRSSSFPDVLSFANGVFFDTGYSVLAPDCIESRLFDGQERVIFKIDNSQQGRGIFFFDRKSFDLNEVYRLGNGLFQRFIVQHEVFREFARMSVATVRMTTVIDDHGVASLRACYLRLGTGSDTHVQSRSHVRVPIDLRTGAFGEVGYTTTWLETDRHPTSGVAFRGKCIPSFGRCVSLVTDLHTRVPYARCIGWDVTVDEDESVKVMEWNGQHNDIKFSEATQGPCFADQGWTRFRTDVGSAPMWPRL